MLYAKVDQEGRDEIKKGLKTAQKAKWYRRLKVIDLSGQGESVSKIAEIFDLNENTVRGYINRYNADGLAGLKPNGGQGRRVSISLSKEELSAIIERSPSQYEKLETGARNWNQALMRVYLKQYHQLEVSQSVISDTFNRLGIPWNRAKKSNVT